MELQAARSLLNQLPLVERGIRKAISSTAFRTLRSTGAFSVIARSKRRRESLLILCYHGLSMSDEHEWLPQLYIRPEQFRERLEFLRDVKASVLPLTEALSRLQKGTLPPRSVTITFDDGFQDFLQHGVPMLKEFGFPCTLYLTTHYANYRLPVISLLLDYLLWRCGAAQLSLPEYGVVDSMPLGSYAKRQAVVREILGWMEQAGLRTDEKDAAARRIADRLGVDYQRIIDRRMLQIMSPDEIWQTAQSGVDIQLHTHRHRTPRDRALFTREVEQNRERIAEITGKHPVHFCYPSGDYSPEFFRWLAECGVQSATTCDSGLAVQNSLAMRLPRVLDHSRWGMAKFESAVAGLLM